MDTGLTPAQETFVEAWSPERVLEMARTMRQLVIILQHWTRTQVRTVPRSGCAARACNSCASILISRTQT